MASSIVYREAIVDLYTWAWLEILLHSNDCHEEEIYEIKNGNWSRLGHFGLDEGVKEKENKASLHPTFCVNKFNYQDIKRDLFYRGASKEWGYQSRKPEKKWPGQERFPSDHRHVQRESSQGTTSLLSSTAHAHDWRLLRGSCAPYHEAESYDRINTPQSKNSNNVANTRAMR